jgi:acyl carrier protein
MSDLRQTIRDAISRVAPDVDPSSIPNDAEIREEAGLDSMDLLSVLAEVAKATGVEVPEAEYGSITTIDDFAEYLRAHVGA